MLDFVFDVPPVNFSNKNLLEKFLQKNETTCWHKKQMETRDACRQLQVLIDVVNELECE